MEEVKITEDIENKIVWLETPKRKERIKIFVPIGGFAHWKAVYENGSDIPEVSGVFLTKRDAIKAVSLFLNRTKVSEAKKHDEWFGEDEKKVLRTKKRASRAKADIS